MALLSEWADTAAAIVSDLQPVVSGEADAWRFVQVDGLMPIEGEPLVADRAFDVIVQDSGTTLAMLGTDAVQRRGRVEVAIRYHAQARQRETRARIDADVTLVADALEDPDGFDAAYGANVVQLVTHTGTTTTFDGPAAIVRLAFDVLYTEEKH